MRIESQRKLFVGLKIDNKTREQLERCPQRDRVFFESEDGRYLVVLKAAEGSYIGKLIDGATPARTIDDIRRNVVSILNRICPGRRDEDEIKVLATDPGDPPQQPHKRGEEPDSERGGERGSYW